MSFIPTIPIIFWFLSTIGIEFTTQYFKFDDEKVRVDYVDTAGQETFRAISANYIKKADGVILIFDITERSSFDLINIIKSIFFNHLN